MPIIYVPSPRHTALDTKIKYEIYDKSCVFSQINYGNDMTSSINMAEAIIEAICKQEGLLVHKMIFLDFQSSVGVLASSGYNTEDYMYDELIFDESYDRVIAWNSVVCPPEVVQDFGIGPSPKQINLPKK